MEGKKKGGGEMGGGAMDSVLISHKARDLQYLLSSAALPKLIRAIARNGLDTWPSVAGIMTTNQGQPTRACLRYPGRFDRIPQMTECYK